LKEAFPTIAGYATHPSLRLGCAYLSGSAMRFQPNTSRNRHTRFLLQ
jgi:hypothetical protein